MLDLTKKILKVKFNLLKKLLSCKIFVGETIITNQKLLDTINKLSDDIKVNKSDIEDLNKFWNKLSSALENCIDADDLYNYIQILFPTSMNKKLFWSAYTVLEDASTVDLENHTYKVSGRNRKYQMKPIYGTSFNQFKQGQ